MDGLTKKVGSIECSLTQSSKKLDNYETTGRTEIGQDVVGMRDALLQSNQRIEHVAGEVKSCMRLIEGRPAKEVDLKPQIAWLSTNIASILTDFQTAENKAQDAMAKTMAYENNVNDVSQDIAVQQRELGLAQQESQQLATRAAEQLRTSQRLVDEAEESMRQKTTEITNKTREAATLRAKLPGLQKSLQQTQESLAEARTKAEKKKAKAVLGFSTAIISIGLAPVTGGLSLLAAGVGAGVGAGMALDYNDLKDEISSTEWQIASLNTQIQDAENSVTSLAKEKSQLQSRVSDLRLRIQRQKTAQISHQNQISKVNNVQTDITSLNRHAETTSSTVKTFARELLQLKQALNECAATVDQENTELRVNTSQLDKFLFRSTRQRRELGREKAAILQASEALSQVGAKIPSLLPSSNIKFLELKLATSGPVVPVPGQTPIPPVEPRG
ncbi:hypothetical protein BGZ61DRAFT_555760 [Ilyonectria robusta]|uniref:uncharacterized protein n=1 Tax=Ilyonectria robusta TaxID=1079257 RepID=UPI001E8E8890|nr:uncharacterized protein BGZ61DRAFT_555760 [Ilyonectria robusta]KAH8645553.1 hypothetical protein BGZ61DRAFT_555760 [Ilyonectria robusta]